MARDPLNEINKEMELIKVWIKEVRGFDEMRDSHNDSLFVQKRMVIEGWLTLVDVQDNADFMATV